MNTGRESLPTLKSQQHEKVRAALILTIIVTKFTAQRLYIMYKKIHKYLYVWLSFKQMLTISYLTDDLIT